jgi:hypothetical protein
LGILGQKAEKKSLEGFGTFGNFGQKSQKKNFRRLWERKNTSILSPYRIFNS